MTTPDTRTALVRAGLLIGTAVLRRPVMAWHTHTAATHAKARAHGLRGAELDAFPAVVAADFRLRARHYARTGEPMTSGTSSARNVKPRTWQELAAERRAGATPSPTQRVELAALIRRGALRGRDATVAGWRAERGIRQAMQATRTYSAITPAGGVREVNR